MPASSHPAAGGARHRGGRPALYVRCPTSPRRRAGSAIVESLLITCFPYDLHQKLEERLRLFYRVMGKARAVRRDGSAALDLCYVAAGRADGFWEEVLKPWDMHAGRLVLSEAGGRSTRLDGSALGLGPDGIVATNGLIHEALVGALREELKPALV